MTLEDPFFVVKDEVFKALNKTRGLYLRWIEIQEDTICVSKEEIEWINTELKNSLHNKELTIRKKFIDCTREEVKLMRDKINMNRGRDRDLASRQPLLDTGEVKVANSHGTTKYSKLENDDSPQRNFINDTFTQQQYLTRQQEEHLEAIGESLNSLKNVSRHIGVELDEQAGMLDEFGTEMDATESRLDSTMKRMAKALHMTTDRRQWTAIIVLAVILFIVILLFIQL
ncbi:hypothetical protein WA026_016946 [Henosepilachna vigintioctopunctata]|uniref:t-SNARE coiled-coil homology domain-containing protein n=1 Tax=Henosepilachna vigintioctopunctata TaxID=420089 RepID=A0AAW1U807_9CUCU